MGGGGAASRASLEIRNDRGEIEALGMRITEAAGRAGYSDASCFAVRLAVEEAVVNAFRHGHRDASPEEPVDVEFDVSAERIRVSVEDHGRGFDPSAVPDPTAPENITKTSGRGLLLIRSYMSDVCHNDRGNRIEMRYDKPAS
ncbi:MAG: ATP-binding protein [Planctomycetota bacterium]